MIYIVQWKDLCIANMLDDNSSFLCLSKTQMDWMGKSNTDLYLGLCRLGSFDDNNIYLRII